MAIEYATQPRANWEIDPRKLRHRYFVQSAPDNAHLVTGMLQQDTYPKTGNWLEVGKITRDFPVRYFVQYTQFHTLVPGSLIQGDALPEGRWKELKKVSGGPWYRVSITAPDGYLLFLTGSAQDITGYDEFNTQKVLTALDLVFPLRDTSIAVTIRLYYFRGNYEELGEDPSQLVPFSTGDFHLGLFVTGTGYTDTMVTTPPMPASLRASASILPQTYSIILGILDETNEVTDYLVLENIIQFE